MKPYFLKWLPVKGKIEEHSLVITRFGLGTVVFIHQAGDKIGYEIEYHNVDVKTEIEGVQLAKLFLCSRDIQAGDKVYPFIEGHMDDIEKGPFYPGTNWCYDEYGSGWPNDPHTILDLNHSEYKSHRIRTDFGFGSPGRYVKVIGEVSPGAMSFAKEGMELGEDEVADTNGSWIGKPFSNYQDEPKLSAGQDLRNSGIWKIAVKGPCGHFH